MKKSESEQLEKEKPKSKDTAIPIVKKRENRTLGDIHGHPRGKPME
jgi:hypothetical protein